jgi:hypothetical protein
MRFGQLAEPHVDKPRMSRRVSRIELGLLGLPSPYSHKRN